MLYKKNFIIVSLTLVGLDFFFIYSGIYYQDKHFTKQNFQTLIQTLILSNGTQAIIITSSLFVGCQFHITVGANPLLLACYT